MFLATPGSSEDIFLNFFAVGFIQSVDNLVVEALRKSPFSRDADQEWEVQVEYRTLLNWCGNAFTLPLDYRYRTSCRTTLAEDRGVMALTWNASSGQVCVQKKHPTRTSPISGSQTSSSSSAFHSNRRQRCKTTSYSYDNTWLATTCTARKRQASPTRHPKPRNSNTGTVQGMNICVQPPGGKIKHIRELITFKNAVQVELDHRIECAWATSTRHRQELTSPKYPLRDRLKKLYDATVTP